MRVLVALSGGVDSSVAAARLVDAGHDVTGVHLALAPKQTTSGRTKGCCTLDDARDARRVADMLGIPFYVWDLGTQFREEVVDDFLAEYAAGRTPNPCLRCNERIKFAAVLDRAIALGFDAVATGHYARIVDGAGGRELHRSTDAAKDQSYVLGVLDRRQLAFAMFPLGDDAKEQVRAEAERRGLLVARKPDSHDICFIPDGDTGAFLSRRLGAQPGEVVDAITGEPLGTHDGAFLFTIGQRRGLGLRVPPADGSPRYVTSIDIERGRVELGPAELLDVVSLEGSHCRWLGDAMGEDEQPVLAQVRAHGDPVPARARLLDHRLRVRLDVPIRGLATGQTVVLYDGTRVLGSATIDATVRAVTAIA